MYALLSNPLFYYISITVIFVITCIVTYFTSKNHDSTDVDKQSSSVNTQINTVLTDLLGDGWPYVLFIIYAGFGIIVYLAYKVISSNQSKISTKQNNSSTAKAINWILLSSVIGLSIFIIFLSVNKYTTDINGFTDPNKTKTIKTIGYAILGICVAAIAGKISYNYAYGPTK